MVNPIQGWSDTARTVGGYEACMVGGGTDEVEDGGDNDNKGYHNGYDGISLVRITILVGSSEIVDKHRK